MELKHIRANMTVIELLTELDEELERALTRYDKMFDVENPTEEDDRRLERLERIIDRKFTLFEGVARLATKMTMQEEYND